MLDYIVIHNSNGKRQIILIKNIAYIELNENYTSKVFLNTNIHIEYDTSATVAILNAVGVNIEQMEEYTKSIKKVD